ncbi:MAG: Hsp70 family protein, partial [Lewinella sp.]|nr:Hsp70 family protein [Lewinella sp.]
MAKFSIDLKAGSIKEAPSPSQRKPIIGIDLGTTNSLVAYVNAAGEAVAVSGADQRSVLVPSLLYFPANGGEVMVGDAARPQLIKSPERSIYSVKRLMGKSYQDVSAELGGRLGYEIIDEDEDRLVKIRVDDNFYTPIELSAFILKELKSRVEAALDQPVSQAVITVPAYFNDAQRQATRDAGRLAGLDVLRIVNEPTAAALAYGIGLGEANEGQTIAVYDLGGGTFDVSLLRIEQGIFEVLATNGDTFLGGDDFDQAIVKYWTEHYNLNLEEQPQGQAELRLLAERAKKQLSSQPNFTADFNGQTIELTAFTCVSQTKPLIDRTLNACRQALQDAQLSTSDIDHVIVVGGSTRMPAVKEAVGDFFGRTV